MLSLKLKRPLAVFDIESTGTNPRQDRIVELAIIKILPNGARENHVFRVNPEINIPAEVTAIHGITDDDVADKPPFRKLAPMIMAILEGCDLAGFGVIRFDIPMLIEEFARAGLRFDDAELNIIDAQRIFHKKEPRDLSAALSFFCGKQHSGAHGAEADALATVSVLDAQLTRYPDLPKTVEELDEYCKPKRDPDWADRTGKLKWTNDEIVINFGVQKKGRSLRDLAQNDPKYLKWLLNSDFPGDTKEIVQNALENKFPPPPQKTAAKVMIKHDEKH